MQRLLLPVTLAAWAALMAVLLGNTSFAQANQGALTPEAGYDVIRVQPVTESPDAALELPERPNIVLVLTDDQRAGTELSMPVVRRELIERGVRFPRAVVPTSWCCPSRASLLTGRFAHGTGVWDNSTKVPYGGWPAFTADHEPETLATALKAVGYRTGLFGKYLNGLELSAINYVPPGWDQFTALRSSGNGYTEFPTNDGVRHVNQYSTDFFAAQAAQFVAETPPDQPVFVYFSPFAPHSPYLPGSYAGASAPHIESMYRDTAWPAPTFRADLPEGKPDWMRDLDPQQELSDRVDLQLEDLPRAQQDALMGVDAAVESLLRTLLESGRLENTLIVLMSDNGYSWGEYDLIGKNTPYRSSIEVPLVLRWDAAKLPERTDSRLAAANIDVTATIVQAARASLGNLDGVSLLDPPSRVGVLLEATTWRGQKRRPAYCGWRSARYLYVQYADGFQELYDYAWDPFEMSNVASVRAYSRVVDDHRRRTAEACSPAPPGFAWTD